MKSGLAATKPPGEDGIDLAGDAAIAFMRRPHGLGWAGGSRRGARWRIVPEPAVLEDLADLLDSVALMGLDDDDDSHGPAALGAAERVGVVDLLDQHGPSSAVQRGGLCGRGVLVVGRLAHVSAGEGFAIYVNGRLLGESTAGVGKRQGAQPRGGHVYADFRDEFKGGKVTIAATSFLRYNHPRIEPYPPSGHLTLWMEEAKIPPVGK